MTTHASALTSGSIPRTLFAFTLPILMGNVLQSISGSINAIWIGLGLGSAALAAANNVNILMFLLFGSVFGSTMAATILIAQHFGARNLAAARRVVGTSVTFFMAVALVFTIAGLVASPALLRWMGTPEEAMPLANAYLRLTLAALPPSFAFFLVMGALRGAGDAKTPFRFLVLSVVLTVALNPLLIFGYGPVPGLGIAGSGLATLVAQVVSVLAMLRHIYRAGNPLALHAGDLHLLRPDLSIVRTIVTKGVPMGLQMIVLSSSMVLFLRFVNRYGTETAAAFAAAMQLWSYVQMPPMSLGAAVSSMAAQNIGAQRWDRVLQTARVGVALNFALTGIPIVVLYVLSHYALGLFLPRGSASIAIAEHINHIVLWSFPLFGVAMVLSGVMRAAGDVIAPLLVLAFAVLGVRIPLAWAGAERFGVDGLWWAFTISAAIAMLLSVLYYLTGRWKSARMTPAAAPPRAS